MDGIIFIGTRPVDPKKNEHIKRLDNKIPVLMINDFLIDTKIYFFLTDEVKDAYEAVDYLIKNGHKKIAYITGEMDYTTYKNKLKGYELALEQNKIELREDYIIKDVPYADGGYRATMKVFDLESAPTAIFAASDQMAMGVIKATCEKGYRVPEDISIIGYGNVPISADLSPELTTVDQFPYNTGTRGAEMLLKVLDGQQLEENKVIMEPKLLIRKSCKEI